MRLFQRLGIAETMAADSSVTRHTRIRDADGEEMITVPAELCGQGWDSHYSLYQPSLERTLDAKVRVSGKVTVLQGWAAEQIETTEDGSVRLRIASGTDRAGQWTPTGEHDDDDDEEEDDDDGVERERGRRRTKRR